MCVCVVNAVNLRDTYNLFRYTVNGMYCTVKKSNKLCSTHTLTNPVFNHDGVLQQLACNKVLCPSTACPSNRRLSSVCDQIKPLRQGRREHNILQPLKVSLVQRRNVLNRKRAYSVHNDWFEPNKIKHVCMQ